MTVLIWILGSGYEYVVLLTFKFKEMVIVLFKYSRTTDRENPSHLSDRYDGPIYIWVHKEIRY